MQAVICIPHHFIKPVRVSRCVTTETRHLDRLGQLGEFEQDSNTDSEQESNTDSHSACFSLCLQRKDVVPKHQFTLDWITKLNRQTRAQVLNDLRGAVRPTAFAVSLTKGMRIRADGPQLISQAIIDALHIDCRCVVYFQQRNAVDALHIDCRCVFYNKDAASRPTAGVCQCVLCPSQGSTVACF